MLILLPSIVNVPKPRLTLPPESPPPERELIDWLRSLRFSDAAKLLARTTAEFGDKALTTPVNNIPELSCVVPKYVLFVPDKEKVPVPEIVKPPVPLIPPE